MTLSQIKTEKENKVSALIKQCSMFFAFSNEQFQENKTSLQEGEKYVHLGAGAYIPKGQVNSYLTGIDEVNKWYKAAIKDGKLKRENIIYELNNHEAFYSGDIEDTLKSLGSDYTAAEVYDVLRTEYKNQTIEY